MASLLKHLFAVAVMVLAGNDLSAQTLPSWHAFSALNNSTNSDGTITASNVVNPAAAQQFYALQVQ